MALLLAAAKLAAQVTAMPSAVGSVSSSADGSLSENTLILGTSTGIAYDSNALSSHPPVSNVQYTIYPLVGVHLARPRWDALISFVPGLSYSNGNLPQYQALSLVSGTSLEFRPTERLKLHVLNTLVSSSNPFDSLSTNSGPVPAGSATATVSNLNYLPRTNELVSGNASYNLSARTSLFALASYNYFGYQDNPNIPSALQPFQQSSSTDITVGANRGLSSKYTETVQYEAQLVDAGQGRIKTLGQSLQYGLMGAPTASFRWSAMAGPEYLQNSYTGLLPSNGALAASVERASGWTWTGSFALSETFGKNQISAKASKQLGIGTQYQGSARQTSIEVDYTRHLPGRTDLVLFGSYNTNSPAFVAQSIVRLANNYSSSGATVSKSISQRWTLSCAYWYLNQSIPETGGQFYSGNHNRVAFTLSYSIMRPLSQ
ncbi:MAG TPA: hypothetical protein VE779_09575 [Candidatus Angelobacter sp.]|nr:hypothetical protein [Candidatus Angelobacter sp.]